MTPKPLPRLATVGEIAGILDVNPRRVAYILESRRHIQPKAIAAGARCYDDEAIAMIRHELAAIAARRAARNGNGRRNGSSNGHGASGEEGRRRAS